MVYAYMQKVSQVSENHASCSVDFHLVAVSRKVAGEDVREAADVGKAGEVVPETVPGQEDRRDISTTLRRTSGR